MQRPQMVLVLPGKNYRLVKLSGRPHGIDSFHNFDLTVASGAFCFFPPNILIVWIEHFEPIFLLYTIIYRLFVVNMVFTWVWNGNMSGLFRIIHFSIGNFTMIINSQ